MRARRLLTTAMLTLIPFAAGSADAVAEGLSLPELRDARLENGLRVLLVRHATVPMVSVELWIDAGATLDPTGEEGLASLTAESLRKGAGELDAEAFAEALDYLGADLSPSVDSDRTRVGLSLLAKDLETGLGLMADAVLRPRLDPEEIQRLAARRAESVLQAKENPRNVLGDYHRAHLFGDHPYAKPVDGTETSLAALDAEKVRRFHRDHYGADRSILVLVGDLQPDAVLGAVRAAFGAMPLARAERPALAPPTPPSATRVLLVDKVDTPQTWFQIGTVGPSWSNLDDWAATELVQTIFGGRFTSWLNSALRIESGLTYGASYRIDRGRVGGSATISTFTAKATTKEAIDLALATLDRLHDEGLSAEDLASAKAYVKGQMPYDYETAADLARVTAQMAFYGIDRAWLDQLFQRIDAVTLADCDAVIDRWFARENLVFTAIGVADEVRDVLGDYGPLTERENEAPGFAPRPRSD